MIQDSSNGSDILNREIKNSEGRLKAAKSGVPLEQICPEQDASYYIPDVESYFKGQDRIKRKKGIEDASYPAEQVKFFITEGSVPQSQ